jgi:hypothetical protein
MQSIISKVKSAKVLALGVLFVTLFSFSAGTGGEGFEIYLNNKLVLQQYGSQMDAVKSLQLDQRFYNDELMVKYHHCGRVGKSRSITIKDSQNKILKEWHFSDAAGSDAAMSCKVKDILGLKKGNGKITLNLYYSSSELPKGRVLASIVLGEPNIAKL